MKARLFITVTFVGGMVLVWGCSQPSQTVIQSQRERNWLEADSSAISSAKELGEPQILPKTHFAAAQLLEQQGQLDQAIIQYRRAVAVNHDYVEAYNRLGMLLGRSGRHDDAESALRSAVELVPQSPTLRNNLGYEYALQGRWSDAEAELNNAIRLKPDFARAYVNLGMVLAKQERFEEALDAFNTVLLEPDAFYNLGLLLRSQHRYHDAADAFRHVLNLNPRFAAAKRQLDAIAPNLTLETPLEPVADLDRMIAKNDAAKTTQPPAAEVADDAAPVSVPSNPTLADGNLNAVLASATTAMTLDHPYHEADPVDDTGEITPCPVEYDDQTYEVETDDPSSVTEAPAAHPEEGHRGRIDEVAPVTYTEFETMVAEVSARVAADDQADDIDDALPCPEDDYFDEIGADDPAESPALMDEAMAEISNDHLPDDLGSTTSVEPEPVDQGDAVAVDALPEVAEQADTPGEAVVISTDPPVGVAVVSPLDLTDALAGIVIPLSATTESLVAELTGAPSPVPNPPGEGRTDEVLSCVADDPPWSLWPVTYDPCAFFDEGNWPDASAMALVPWDAQAAAWYSALPGVVPIDVTAAPDPSTVPNWFSQVTTATMEELWMPITEMYPLYPELTPDESVTRPQPCPEEELTD